MRAFLAPCLATLAIGGASAACTARVGVGSQWVFPNGTQAGDVHLDISNTDGTNLSVPWDLSVQNSAYTGILQSWNLDGVVLAAGTVTAKATLPWEGLLPNGASTVDLGFVASYTGGPTALFPTAVSVAGGPCTVSTGPATPGTTPAGPAVSSSPSTGAPLTSTQTPASSSPPATTAAGLSTRTPVKAFTSGRSSCAAFRERSSRSCGSCGRGSSGCWSQDVGSGRRRRRPRLRVSFYATRNS